MTTAYSSNLSLALPVQGELSGTWGDTVNNGITQYADISIAGTLTLDGDGAVTLASTTGGASSSNIGSTTAQYAILRITGTLSTTKVITAPASSKTYVVINAATGGSVTIKASGQTGVTVAPGEIVYTVFNGTDYDKLAGDVTGPVSSADGALAAFDGTTGRLIKQAAAPGTAGNVLTSDGTNWVSSAAAVTLAGAQTLTNKTIEAGVFTNGYTEEVFAVSGTTPALSPTNGSIQTWTLSGNSTPTSGTWAEGQSITLMVDDGTAYTITWTSLAVTWKTDFGLAPALNTTGFTAIALWKVGSVIYGARVGDA